MSLIIHKISGHEDEFHLPFPKEINQGSFQTLVRYIDNIKFIQANGDELAYILNRYANIPCLRIDHNYNTEGEYFVGNIKPTIIPEARAYTMKWFGSTAQFIIANL